MIHACSRFTHGRFHRLTLLVAGCLALLCGPLAEPASSTVVYLRGKTEPVIGYLERMDESSVLIRQLTEDGRANVVTIARDDIEDLLIPIDESRLESLDPANVMGYRDYAEELAVKQIDPEAIDLAIRLYLIVAQLGDESQKQSAFRGLIDIARNPEEELQFRALAFRMLPERNRTMLWKPKPVAVTVGSLTTGQRTDLTEAIKLLRNEQYREAAAKASSDSVESAFEAFESTLTYETFRNVCSRRELPDGLLPVLLQIEIALITPAGADRSPADPSQTNDESWGQTMTRATQPLKLVSLERVTEFDPRKSVYRNGDWVAP